VSANRRSQRRVRHGLGYEARGAARLGQLYLNGGTWNGVRIVPADWVELSQQRVNRMGGDSYGYLWWKHDFVRAGATLESYFTSGNGGNYVFVVPALDLVVMFTGSNYNTDLSQQPFTIMTNGILPAVN
jgi:CubicO group peptidase (beta-lactamase class C family)